MTNRYEKLASRIDERFGEQVERVTSIRGELTIEVDKDDLIEKLIGEKKKYQKQEAIRQRSKKKGKKVFSGRRSKH